MWKPASSTPAKRPRRSTTKACCWGTTTAVRATIQNMKMARTRNTTNAPPSMTTLLRPGRDRPGDASFRDEPQGESFDAFDPAPLPFAQGDRPRGARGPGGAPHLGLAGAVGPHVFQHHRGLLLHPVDGFRAARHLEAAHDGTAKDGHPEDGEHGEEEPLHPR